MKCTTTLLLVCSASLLAIVGCADNSAVGARDQISATSGGEDAVPKTSAEPADETSLETTQAALTWSATPAWHSPYLADPHDGNAFVRFSGNDGLIFASSQHRATVHRASDGAFVGTPDVAAGLALAADWSTIVVPTPDGAFSVQNPVTGELLTSVTAPDAPSSETWWAYESRTVLSKDGTLAVTLICWGQPGDGLELMSVTGYDAGTGEMVVHSTIEGSCGLSNWVNGPAMELTDDASGAVIAIRPFGDEVAVVDQSATIRRFSLPDLTPLGEPLTAGAGGINMG
ncbi:MAG: hypothetical protein ACI9OJ_001320 [Myxococcota bacterium]|jgi:hypothetical protein